MQAAAAGLLLQAAAGAGCCCRPASASLPARVRSRLRPSRPSRPASVRVNMNRVVRVASRHLGDLQGRVCVSSRLRPSASASLRVPFCPRQFASASVRVCVPPRLRPFASPLARVSSRLRPSRLRPPRVVQASPGGGGRKSILNPHPGLGLDRKMQHHAHTFPKILFPSLELFSAINTMDSKGFVHSSFSQRTLPLKAPGSRRRRL